MARFLFEVSSDFQQKSNLKPNDWCSSLFYFSTKCMVRRKLTKQNSNKINHWTEKNPTKSHKSFPTFCNKEKITFRKLDKKIERKTITRCFFCLIKIYREQLVSPFIFLFYRWMKIFKIVSSLKSTLELREKVWSFEAIKKYFQQNYSNSYQIFKSNGRFCMKDFAWKIYKIWSFLFFKEVVDPQKSWSMFSIIHKKM
jgi:hypothetical protein